MGPNVKRHVAVMGPGMIQGMADSKPAQREKAVHALNVWVSGSIRQCTCLVLEFRFIREKEPL